MNSKDNKYSSNYSINGNKSNKKSLKNNNDLKSDNNSYQKGIHQHQHHSTPHHPSNESTSDNKSKLDSNEMSISVQNLKKHGQSSFTGSNLSFNHHSKNHLESKQSLVGIDKIKYRRTKLGQVDVNSSNYTEIIRLTSLLDEAYAKIKDLTSENKKLKNNQKVQERALKSTNELVGDYPKTVEKLIEEIRVLKSQNKKYAEKLVSAERAQVKKTSIQNSTDSNFELKEKNHKLHEELEHVKQKMSEYEKNNGNYQKIYDQLVKRTKFCKEKIAENKILLQKNQKLEKDIIKFNFFFNILLKLTNQK
jgi:DNA repair exonuclease SbcCD ATPase subunit